MTRLRILGLLALLTCPVPGQVSTSANDPDWLLSEFATTGGFGGLARLNPITGVLSPIATGLPAGAFNAVTMASDNHAYAVAYSGPGVLAFVSRNGVIGSTVPFPNSPNALALNQDGTWSGTTSAGSLWRMDPRRGTAAGITTIPPVPNAHCIDQDTGDWIVGQFEPLPGGKLLRINPITGARTTIATGLGRVSGVDHHAPRGSFIVTSWDRGTLEVTPSGQVTTISTFSLIPNAVKVMDDTGNFVVGGGFAAPGPNEVGELTPQGTIVRLFLVPKSISGVEIDESRGVTVSGPATPGSTMDVLFSFRNAPRAPYFAALSTGLRPGLPLGDGRTVNLDFTSPLFGLSIGGIPGVTDGFVGVTDNDGKARGRVRVPPQCPGGLRVHVGAIAAPQGPPGILVVADPEGFTTREAPLCQVFINGPSCLCRGQTVQYTAYGSPEGGTFQWRITAGAAMASIVGAANEPTVTVRGDAVSTAVGDVTLEATYTVNGRICSSTQLLTVVDVQLAFSAQGRRDANNAVVQNPAFGDPVLGPVRPGQPAGCLGFYKNIQIRGTIRPCGGACPCSFFDFRRDRQGRLGVIPPGGGFVPDELDCPGPDWCDDDQTNQDEDLDPDPPPDCTIYVIDTPGVLPGACGAGNNGEVIVHCNNFREWLEVNLQGDRCTANLDWHASTRLRCNGTNWVEDPGGAGNVVGEGHIVCGTTFWEPPPPWAGRAFDVAEVVRMLASGETAERLHGQNWVLEEHRAGRLGARAREDLITALLVLARGPGEGALPAWSTPMLAARLLGFLRSVEAIPLLLERLLDEFPRPIVRSRDTYLTVAADALSRIGLTAAGPILSRVASASEEEWRALRMALWFMEDRPTVRSLLEEVLQGQPDPRVSERVGQLLSWWR